MATKRIVSVVNERIGERIKDLRRIKKLTQTEFGKKFYLSQNDVTQIENGKKTVSYEVLLDIAEYFGKTTDYFIKKNPVDSDNPKLQYICDYTGLSEKAIDYLNNDEDYFDFKIAEFIDIFIKELSQRQDIYFSLCEIKNKCTYSTMIEYKDYADIEDYLTIINGFKYAVTRFFDDVLNNFSVSELTCSYEEFQSRLAKKHKELYEEAFKKSESEESNG